MWIEYLWLLFSERLWAEEVDYRRSGEHGFVIYTIVPASTPNDPYSAPRQPKRQEKTPWKRWDFQGVFLNGSAWEAAALLPPFLIRWKGRFESYAVTPIKSRQQI